MKFDARLTHSTIAVATSNTPSGPWTYWKTILTGRHESWDQLGACQPNIYKFGAQYYLYYVSCSTDIPKNELKKEGPPPPSEKLTNSRCIGVARANSYKGPWQRLDKPIITAQTPYSGFSCSPSVTQTPDGQYLIMVCSKSGKKGNVSYVTKSANPFFDKPHVQSDMPGELFSLRYNASKNRYQFMSNGDEKNFIFQYSSSLKTPKTEASLKKPTNLPSPTPVKTKNLHSPNVYLGDNGSPEVFIFHSIDPKNGGIFTIPFKK